MTGSDIYVMRKHILSTDGIHLITGLAVIPKGKIRGILQISHGMTEYIERYRPFMEEIAREGFLVCGHDHLGHGGSVMRESEYGFFGRKDGWKHLVNDTILFARSIRKQFGDDLPCTLMGHSMGSFIARLAMTEYDGYDKLIIMGTGGAYHLVREGCLAISLLRFLYGEHGKEKLIEKLVFGAYNSHFEGKSRYTWLSTDPAFAADFENDPLTQFRFSASGMKDLLTLSREANSKRCFEKTDTTKPILLLSGEEDPVGEYGRGVKRVYRALVHQGCRVNMILYPGCRHEILHDSCRQRVIETIEAFLSA